MHFSKCIYNRNFYKWYWYSNYCCWPWFSDINDSDDTANTIDENVADGTYTGVTYATDADGETVTYSYLMMYHFSIDENGRIVTDGEIDYETQDKLYTFTIIATSADGTSTTKRYYYKCKWFRRRFDSRWR